MEGDILAFAQVMTVIITSATVLIAVGLAARHVWRLGSRPRQRAPMIDESRMERIENAVDAIAIEVERISEAQRFTTTLLADRLPARAERVPELGQPGVAKRINTPH
jgi:hypothetical protein